MFGQDLEKTDGIVFLEKKGAYFIPAIINSKSEEIISAIKSCAKYRKTV